MWTCAKRRTVKLIYRPGEDAFSAIPQEIRRQGPWTDARRGPTVDLKPEIRLKLARDGYVLIEVDTSARGTFDPEA